MITIEKQLPDFDDCARLLGYAPETCLFLDIETTGFSFASSSLYLIGTITPDDSGQNPGRVWKLTQWMAEDKQEEPAILERFLRFSEPFETLIHFNGTTFDLPYLAGKQKQYKLAGSLSWKRSLDLYRAFRPLKALLGLDHMNQEALQSFLGAKRADPLSGKALIPVWHRYTEEKSSGQAQLLLLHNQEDLTGMTGLLRLSACLALLEGRVFPQSCRLCGDHAVFTLRPEYALPQNIRAGFRIRQGKTPEALADESGARCILTAGPDGATLEIPVFRGELRYFFPNYRDYYYLPLEDQAIHRSVASFVDREHRVPARPSSCYIRQNSVFLPQPSKLVSPVFVPSYRSREFYFEYTKDLEQHPESLIDYIKAVLKCFPGPKEDR